MDRLLCGDVGYGKTEVAMRAAFKAVDAGYQVAVLVPTTVLAEQHCRTFSADGRVSVSRSTALSRFCTAKEQKQILEAAGRRPVDIVIGTHRLAQPDVQFANLGPAHHRRRAAIRRRSQGAAQGAAARRSTC